MQPTRAAFSLILASTLLAAAPSPYRPIADAREAQGARFRRDTIDLSGSWSFDVAVNARTTSGEFQLWRREDDYTGTLTVRGARTLPIRALTASGVTVRMTVDSPEGPVVFDGTLERGACDMRGVVTYHAGQRYPMRAQRLAPRDSAAAGSSRLDCL